MTLASTPLRLRREFYTLVPSRLRINVARTRAEFEWALISYNLDRWNIAHGREQRDGERPDRLGSQFVGRVANQDG